MSKIEEVNRERRALAKVIQGKENLTQARKLCELAVDRAVAADLDLQEKNEYLFTCVNRSVRLMEEARAVRGDGKSFKDKIGSKGIIYDELLDVVAESLSVEEKLIALSDVPHSEEYKSLTTELRALKDVEESIMIKAAYQMGLDLQDKTYLDFGCEWVPELSHLTLESFGLQESDFEFLDFDNPQLPSVEDVEDDLRKFKKD